MIGKKYFSYKKSLKNSAYRLQLSSYTETNQLMTFQRLVLKFNFLEKAAFQEFFLIKESREVLNCV